MWECAKQREGQKVQERGRCVGPTPRLRVSGAANSGCTQVGTGHIHYSVSVSNLSYRRPSLVAPPATGSHLFGATQTLRLRIKEVSCAVGKSAGCGCVHNASRQENDRMLPGEERP